MPNSLVNTIWDVPNQGFSGSGFGGAPSGGAASTATGNGAFPKVPAPTTMPPNPYQQVLGLYPSLFNDINQGAKGNIDLESLARTAASKGIGSGMPGSGFQAATGLSLTYDAEQKQRQQNFQNQMSMAGMLGQMQTPQNTAIGLDEYNKQLAAAADPEKAYRQQLADYMMMRNNPAGGSGYGGLPGSYRPSGKDLFDQIQGSIPQRDMSWFYQSPSGGTGAMASGTSSSNDGSMGGEWDQDLGTFTDMFGFPIAGATTMSNDASYMEPDWFYNTIG